MFFLQGHVSTSFPPLAEQQKHGADGADGGDRELERNLACLFGSFQEKHRWPFIFRSHDLQGWAVGCPEDIFLARQAAETLGLVSRLTDLCPPELDGHPLLQGCCLRR